MEQQGGSSRAVCRTPGLCICSINLNSGHLHKGCEPSRARDVLTGPMEMSMFPESMDVRVLRYPHSSISQDPPCLFCPKPSVLFYCHHKCPSEAAGSQPTSLGRVTALRVGCGVTVPAWGQTPRQPHKPLVPSQSLSWGSPLGQSPGCAASQPELSLALCCCQDSFLFPWLVTLL